MRVDKHTFEDGTVEYVITSESDPDAGVELCIRGDGSYDLEFHAGYHVRLDDERIRMLRQALRFIDGRAAE